MSARRSAGSHTVAIGLLLAAAGTPEGPAAVELLGPAPVSFPVCMARRSDDICGFPTMATADFNADGHQDLAINYDHEERLYIMLGDGLGGFKQAASIPGSFSGILAAADFNRDGFQDLAAEISGQLIVHLSDGQGGVSGTTEIPGTGFSLAIQAADLDGNGAADLAIIKGGSPSFLTILLNDGSGGFPSMADIELSIVPAALAIDDFDLNGDADIAVAGWLDQRGVVVVFPGNGTGGYPTVPNRGPDIVAPGQMVSEDFNADQAPDLAIVEDSSVTILLSNGEGTFTLPAEFPLPFSPTSMLADDFNADTRADLAFGSGGVILILLGDGVGGFAGSGGIVPLTATGSYSMASGDFNGDGARDLGLAERDLGTLNVLLGDGLGGFLVSPELLADQGGRSAVVSDLNRDGKPDLAIASWTTDTVILFLGDGTGSFSRSTVAVGDGPMAIAGGDLNADGIQDLAVANTTGDTVTPLLGDGEGGFSRLPDLDVQHPDSIIIEDFNNDSRADLAVGGLDFTVGIFLGSGSGSFSHLADVPVNGQPASFAGSDFDHDGDRDLVVGFQEEFTVVLMGDGHGGFSPVGLPDSEDCAVLAEDFNRDGHPDVAIHGFASAQIYLGDGLGGFTRSSNLRVFTGAGDPDNPEFCLAAAAGDFNGDALPDLAVADGPSTVTILPGDGLGGLTLTSSLQVGSELRALGVADFNTDSSPDLAAINGNARVLLNQLDRRVDLNGSNRIDGFDVATMSRRFGCGRLDACYDRGADINLDGLIEGDDLALFAANRFGRLVRTTSPLRALLEPPSPPAGANSATIRQVTSEGDLLTVEVVLEATEPLAAANFALAYDAEVLTFLGASPGGYLAGPGVLQIMSPTGDATGLVEIGLSRFVQGQLADATPQGPRDLLSVLFKARRTGTTALSFAPFQLPQPTLLNAAGDPIGQLAFQAGAAIAVDAPQGAPGGPRLSLNPGTLDFGSLATGEVSRKRLRISNFGFSELRVQNVSATSPEFDSYFTDSFDVPAFGYVELTVLFSPTGGGMHEGELVVISDDPARPSARVRLIGHSTGDPGSGASRHSP